ncbi:hypothetical protein AWY79_06350 [Pseudodesulfovibrio indicus]|uniref:Uncharacterized protein n=1 Tax=Pseudodesulfovibrio indicus TaxID=1716143 RepID=A0ABM5YTP6_9BACT|nr:hypothetical protein AWY79_06350 [Pseudodesulfovibrio indicus]
MKIGGSAREGRCSSAFQGRFTIQGQDERAVEGNAGEAPKDGGVGREAMIGSVSIRRPGMPSR